MIGGPPIFTPSFVAAPAPVYPAAPRPRPPAARAPGVRAPAPSRGITARGVAPEPRPEPRRERVNIPSPEELGIGVAADPRPADLARAWARLKALGAVGFEVTRRRGGEGWEFVCLMPGTDPDHPRRIVARAGTEAEAIQSGLARAEEAHALRAARK